MRRAPQDLARPAALERGHALLGGQRGVQRGIDLGGREVAVGAAVEHDIERVERALGLPEMIRDDANRVVVAAPARVAELRARPAIDRAGSFTTARTPGIFRMSASFLIAITWPVKDGAVMMAALSMPGTMTSMP